MLRNRYDPLNLFEYIPALSMTMDPTLAQIDILLDDDLIFQQVRTDLSRRYPQTLSNGRPSTPVEVILRLLVLKHLHGWSYEQTEQFVSDSLVLRQFCRVYAQKVPDDTTLLRWANLIQPATLHTLLDHVVHLAQELKVTRGRKLRVDGTVVETNIRYPVDSTLLGDGVRVLTRILRRAKQLVGNTGDTGDLLARARVKRSVFRDRTRSIRRDMKTLMDVARQRGKEASAKLKAAYTRVIAVTQAMVAQAKEAKELLKLQEYREGDEGQIETGIGIGQTPGILRLVHRLVHQLDTFVPRIEQVIAQTTMRVLHGESVCASEKIVSLFEPHTAIIRKGKLGKRVEFGRVLWLDEVEGGIVSGYRVLVGSPAEDGQVRPSLEHHHALFGKPPRLFAADRGVYSPKVEQQVIDEGVLHVVMPKPGAKSQARVAHERQRWFWRGRNWRSGIEGRISVLKRRHKLDRCLYHGDDGMERWVGWGVIAHDLHKIAHTLVA